ncbi:MAG: cation-binding protein [marine bacterium B5-7]|nr:MAG: cation-binding protein [marine bacterium B5-7]
MTQIFEELNNQHKNIVTLIHMIENQIDRVANEEMPNVSLLLDIMQYLTRYVDVSHHPTEELLIARYEQSEAPENHEVHECKLQHRQLLGLGREFLAIVEAVREEQLVERVEFERVGREFIQKQLDHIDLEEGKVFPVLKKSLNKKALKEVREELAQSKDPLFGDIVDKEYQKLYDYIIRSA